MVNSAAVYCERDAPGHVSIELVEGMISLFKRNGLSVREYGLPDNPVCAEGAYAFRDKEPQLYAAVRTGTLCDLDLYCHSEQRHDLLFDWEGAANINLLIGYIHIRLPATAGIRQDELLRQTYTLVKSLTSWRYGIAYSRSSRNAPSLYAAGVYRGHLSVNLVETDEDEELVSCWCRELVFQRRHLKGYFRDVYPANLLSTAHVNAQLSGKETLLTAGLGKLTPIDDGLWLWTVSDEELPRARSALQQVGLLLCP
jgi:hypothetical protein